ncbi:MAG: HTTM domain-containing protein [Crocinitomicaceae bacterium]
MTAIFNRFQKPVSIAPLAMFRVIFGIMVLFSTLRFILKGWVHDLYIKPKYFFTYYGFDWIKPLNETGMYTIFFVMVICAVGIILGYRYKLSALLFFLLFTYVELIDKTNYLNHYYFVSLVSLLLVLVPAGNYFSLDVKHNRVKALSFTPKWTIDIFKFQLGIVYFFAGIAKLNYHWLIEAEPLSNWLKHQTDLPIIGGLMKHKLTAYVFAWSGAIYDLTIPFILLTKKWRVLGYILVIIFHVLTAIMFPIGVFPFVMIASTLIFFSPKFHENCLSIFAKLIKYKLMPKHKKQPVQSTNHIVKSFLILYISLQLLIPFRYTLYKNDLFWTEQGFRFSWRVMLIEKAGYAEFIIKDKNIGGQLIIDNSLYLTPQQEKMMSTQPDMILQFAIYLKHIFKDSIWQENDQTIQILDPIVTVNSRVALFNQGSRPFIDPNINLAAQKRGWQHKNWILPYE